MPATTSSSRGTVSLVALCFIAVLGIVLASYISVCSRAMNLSNRSYQSSLSEQLAEFGMEEGLRAFNRGDWSSWTSTPANMTAGAWSLDTTNKRATRTITLNAGKLGQGVTGTVKIRIDNYDANSLGNTWNSSTTYNVGDLVGRSGVWYRCVRSNSNNTPSLSPGFLYYWVPEMVPWAWRPNKSYQQNVDIVSYSGEWYRCTATHTSNATFNWSNWTWMAAPQLVMLSGTYYWTDQFVYRASNDTWYRCTNGHTPSSFVAGNWEAVSGSSTSTAYIPWCYRDNVQYSYNDIVYHNATWYRFINATATTGVAPPNGSYWENAQSGGAQGWGSGNNYNIDDVVYYSSTSQWYRCIRPHTSSGTITPSNTTYWSNTPAFSMEWISARGYSANDVVRYRGVWYRCILGHTSSTSLLPTNTTYWIGTNTTDTNYLWNATSTYSSGDYRCYSGVWYKCVTGNTGQSPNNTTYWTSTWANAAAVTTGAPVVYAEATLTLSGSPDSRTQLRAIIHPAPLFPNAIGATGTINLGSGGTIDSYDSVTDSGYASPGYAAVVASSYSASTAVTLYSPTVQGYVAAPSATTAPYAPLASFGTNTVIKGTAAEPSPKADTTRISRSAYVPQFDPLPAGGLSSAFTLDNFAKGTALALSNTINLGTPGAATPARYYYNGNLTVGDATLARININGPVILYINGNLTITASGSTGRIHINSTGSAEIHVAGGLKIDVGGEGIYNQTIDPKKLTVICDTSGSTTQFYSDGSYPFYGTLYLPNTTSTTGFYNDNTTVQIYGALSAKMVTYSGVNANVHYDTSLRYATTPGVDQPYAITEWRELPVTEQATMP